MNQAEISQMIAKNGWLFAEPPYPIPVGMRYDLLVTTAYKQYVTLDIWTASHVLSVKRVAVKLFGYQPDPTALIEMLGIPVGYKIERWNGAVWLTPVKQFVESNEAVVAEAVLDLAKRADKYRIAIEAAKKIVMEK